VKTFKATFRGRKKGAQGIFYKVECTVEGEDRESARINLYEDWDHIHLLTLEELC